jgi:hypothetical protein
MVFYLQSQRDSKAIDTPPTIGTRRTIVAADPDS